MRVVVLALTLLTVCMASGCASVSRGSMQQVYVSAYDAKTHNLIPADCYLSNDEGIVYTKSNKSTLVGRDKDPLNIYCHTDTLAGKTTVDGKVNGGFVAADLFLIDFCIISCWVDGLSGAWSEYPTMIDVSLGLKDDSYRGMLKGTHAELKQQVAEQRKQNETYSKSLSNPNDQNYSLALESKKKLEESEQALKLLDLEFASR